MATSGTISKKIGTNSVYTFWLDWKVNSQNTSANTSNVTVTLKAKRNDGYPSYGAYNNYGNNTIKLTVGGSVKVNNTAANIDLRGDGQTLATWTGDVSHSTDGKLNLALEGYFYFNSSAASSLPQGGYTVSGTAAINTIPRKSSVTCTDANVGSAAVITINRASSSFKHTLTYTFGGLSGTIVTKTADTSIGWTLPTTFYAQMTSAKTKSGTITCETFDSSGTSLGTSTCTFIATAVSTVTVSGTVVDTNDVTIALTGDSSKLIKFYSTALATITASTTNSASISSKTINGTSVSADRTFANCETSSFVFAAKDSRGYSGSKTVTPTMIQYIKLTINATIKRDTPTGDTVTLTVKGNYFNGSFGAVDNTLGINFRYRESGAETWIEDGIEPTISGNSYSASVNLSGFDYRTEYEFEINVADLLSGDVATVDVVRGIPVFDWGKEDFNFNVPVTGVSFTGTFYGNIESATKATQDGNGNVIANTYLPLTGGTLQGSLRVDASTNNRDLGVKYTSLQSGNTGALYLFGHQTVGRGLYDSIKGMVISVTDSGATFNGNATGWSAFTQGTGYVGFANNHKICFGSFSTGTYTAATAAGYNYYGDVTISVTFPSAFNGTPALLFQVSGGTTAVIDVEPVTWSSTGITKIRVHRANAATNVDAVTIRYIAIY